MVRIRPSADFPIPYLLNTVVGSRYSLKIVVAIQNHQILVGKTIRLEKIVVLCPYILLYVGLKVRVH